MTHESLRYKFQLGPCAHIEPNLKDSKLWFIQWFTVT